VPSPQLQGKCQAKTRKDSARSALSPINYLCCSVQISVVLRIDCVEICTVLLPPGDNPISVNKYIICVLICLLDNFL
jgi:hypothetical protein